MGKPTKIGYNPFYHIYNSDHRAMFIDLPIKNDFKQKNPIVPADMREIGSKAKHVDKFLSTIYNHLQQNKIFHKIRDFKLDIDNSKKLWKIANQIDKMLGTAIIVAKQQCYQQQKPPWSEALHMALK